MSSFFLGISALLLIVITAKQLGVDHRGLATLAVRNDVISIVFTPAHISINSRCQAPIRVPQILPGTAPISPRPIHWLRGWGRGGLSPRWGAAPVSCAARCW